MEYLIKTGSERVAQQCRENIYAVQTLKDFQYIDRDGKDQVNKLYTQSCKKSLSMFKVHSSGMQASLVEESDPLSSHRRTFLMSCWPWTKTHNTADWNTFHQLLISEDVESEQAVNINF